MANSFLKVFYLSFIFMLIYTSYYFVQATFKPRCKNKLNHDLVSTVLNCVFLILAGFLAAFAISATKLLIGSIFSFVGSIIIFDLVFKYNLSHCVPEIITGILLFAIFFGTFRVVFPVIIMDQMTSNLKDCIAVYLFCLNLATLFGMIIVKLTENVTQIWYIIICLPILAVTAIFLLLGFRKNFYQITTEIVSICQIATAIKNAQSQGYQQLSDRQNVVENAAVVKAVIMFIVLIPYGYLDSQYRSSFINQMHKMHLPEELSIVNNLLIDGFSSVFVMAFIVLIGLLHSRNVNLKVEILIFFGVGFTFLSTLSSAIVETINSKENRTTTSTSPSQWHQSSNRTGGQNVTDLSVMWLIPQMAFSSFSEVLISMTCMPYMYYVAKTTSFKYLTVSLYIASSCIGGLGDVLNVIIKNYFMDINLLIFLWILTGISFLYVIFAIVFLFLFSDRLNEFSQNSITGSLTLSQSIQKSH